ncbi:MAG: hypothetical protein Q7J32_12970 [Sphingomonadaceae bacterium]|nr:hypothetical protein [Sphingomonadaceae bacterium]
MSHASTLRLAHALPLAFGLAFVWPEAADAGFYVPHPTTAAPVDTIVAAPHRPLPTEGRAPAFAVDGEGRSFSISVPSHVRLYALARAEHVAAHTVLEPTGAGTARLSLALDRAVADVNTAGAYVGIVEMSLDYN